MWCSRRIINISWVDKVTNVEVLRRIDKEPKVMNIIKSRNFQYFGSMLRGISALAAHNTRKDLWEEVQGKT